MRNIKFYIVAFIFKLKPALKQEMDKGSTRRIMDKMKDHFREMDKSKPKKTGIMAYHRILLIIGLSLYRAIQEELGNNKDLIDTIHRILWNCGTRQQTGAIAFFVRRSRNPFNLYLRLLGPRNERLFPCPPWEKVEVEVENGVAWHQKKCPYYDFLKDEGAVELTTAFCDLDKRIAELVSDHIELKRQHTLAKGDNWCDFFYYRK
ncbi:L-2-amino-thiazoline-4-carboxylic acid hydrolase [Candidatus Cloacimonadota bacterium]